MRVLFLVEAALGGAGRHVIDLARGLTERGHEVHLVHSPRRADHGFLDGLASLEDTTNFHAHQLQLGRELQPSDAKAYWELLHYAEANGPFGVMHAHSTKAGLLLRLLPRRGAAVVYTPHGLMSLDPELKGPRLAAVRAMESSLARITDRVIAVSDQERSCAVSTGIPSGKLTVIANGSSMDPTGTTRREARARLGLDTGTVCIGAVGRLVPGKEYGRLMDAFALLRRRTRASVQLTIVGGGPEEAALRARATGLGITSEVKLVGEAPARAYYPAFDCFAHPSRYEGFAYTLIEALQAGLPVVTTDVGGAKETVEVGRNGFICDKWAAEEFAEFLQKLVDDPSLRARMSAVSRARAPRFSLGEMVRATEQLYIDARRGGVGVALPVPTP